MKAEKIALIGAPCSGKTTVFETLRKEFPPESRVGFVEEPARHYMQEHSEAITDNSTQLLYTLQDLQLHNEREAHKLAPTHILTDRSVIDYPVYAVVYGDRKGAEMLYQRVKPYLPTYSTLYLCDPKDMPHMKDEKRTESDAERQEIHDAFIWYLNLKEIDYQILSGTLKDRIALIRARLGVGAK